MASSSRAILPQQPAPICGPMCAPAALNAPQVLVAFAGWAAIRLKNRLMGWLAWGLAADQ